MLPECTVRPYAESDWPELHRAVKESEAQLAPWLSWCHPGYSERDARDWIQATLDAHSAKTMFDFAVFDAQGRYVGACGVNQIQTAYRCANLGYWIRTSASGRGLAAAAALRVCEWTFRNTNLNRLEVLAAVDNLPSQRVAQKLNAQYEGRSRSRLLIANIDPPTPTDAFVYSIVRGDTLRQDHVSLETTRPPASSSRLRSS